MTAENTADVVVRGPFQVTHDGVDYRGGDHATVPVGVAQHWHRHGWVDLVDPPDAEQAEPESEPEASEPKRRRR